MKRSIVLFFLVTMWATNIHAQSIGPSTLNATGGAAVIGSNAFDWSVGEMTMVSTFTSSNIIITQGVLQPAPSRESTPNTTRLSKQLRIFPNPAESVVNIEYSSQVQGTLTYRLMDMNGKIVSMQTINVSQGINTQQVNVFTLACATYMLDVTISTGTSMPESISYKIQKIK